MRLLKIQEDGTICLTKHYTCNVPPYAILSHTWGEEEDEVMLEDICEGRAAEREGYKKIQFIARQAASDNLQYFWVDTCCIDQSSSAELSEAINCMFKWYQNASKCYVYLSDVFCYGASANALGEPGGNAWERDFPKSRWFTRGWTLQELVAPPCVEFFSAECHLLGDKQSLIQPVHEATGIAISALRGRPLCDFIERERISWAQGRQTKREEDMAYSLLGIFGVQMPLLYGEGAKNANFRLRRAIAKKWQRQCLGRL
ncbi:hypothetical protein G7054_g7110 [Neopestalotiopsis clavispora]|nr:hypothetical protein G7054_g7110 [Neopestalotiopsis clavispora]